MSDQLELFPLGDVEEMAYGRCRACGRLAQNKVRTKRNGRTEVYWLCDRHYEEAMR